MTWNERRIQSRMAELEKAMERLKATQTAFWAVRVAQLAGEIQHFMLLRDSDKVRDQQIKFNN
jgi:hypothetical protein